MWSAAPSWRLHYSPRRTRQLAAVYVMRTQEQQLAPGVLQIADRQFWEGALHFRSTEHDDKNDTRCTTANV